MNRRERARIFALQRERRITIHDLDAHIAHTRSTNESLADLNLGDVPELATAADLSGVLVDALETAHSVLRQQYSANVLKNSCAEAGDIVLVSQTDSKDGSNEVSYSHEFMLVRDSLAPDGAILSVEPMEKSSDQYMTLPPGGLTDYVGVLSFDQPTQEFLQSIEGLGTMRWSKIVNVWRFLYGRYPRFALRDGSTPYQ